MHFRSPIIILSCVQNKSIFSISPIDPNSSTEDKVAVVGDQSQPHSTRVRVPEDYCDTLADLQRFNRKDVLSLETVAVIIIHLLVY